VDVQFEKVFYWILENCAEIDTAGDNKLLHRDFIIAIHNHENVDLNVHNSKPALDGSIKREKENVNKKNIKSENVPVLDKDTKIYHLQL